MRELFDCCWRWTRRPERKRDRVVILTLSLLPLAACAAYTPPPLTTAHPAHPEAVAAPNMPPSNTLAYTPSDIPSTQPEVAMAVMAQGATAAVQVSGAQKTVVGEGTVVAVVPSSGQIVLDHKAIKDFMDAMTMGYRVESPALLERVKTGDPVRFTIDPEKNVIVKIEKLKP